MGGLTKKLTQEEFVERSNKIHGGIYDYSQAVFKNTRTKVAIICPKHGLFMQAPDKHMAGGGCPHPDCVAERRKATNLRKYGVEHALQAKQFLDKQQATNLRKYGARNVMQVPEIKQRHDDACTALYGTPSPLGSDKIREKVQATCFENHGGIGPMADPAVRERGRQACRRKYGCDNPMQSVEGQAAFKASMLRRRGVENPMWVKEFAGKVMSSRLVNGTLNVSSPEEVLYSDLCNLFGTDDVVRQYRSDRYPWACDFYIKHLDLFIELNTDWSHGGHWFDAADQADCAVLARAQMKFAENEKSRYAGVMETWCKQDIQKRAKARENSLNYVVFWDDRLRDAALWMSIGCPDGRDWEREYSWLPDRDISNTLRRPELTGGKSNVIQLAKYYQFENFYKNEIAKWRENPGFRGTSLQVYLYHNRLKYLGKSPYELSDFELARGFKISGILKGNTSFDVALMQRVLREYDIKSVYDPCAGWGERMLCCAAAGAAYHGVDVNPDLESGYKRMISELDLRECSIIFRDSAGVVPPAGTQAVITCPPYWNTEIYSDAGAENLDYPGFISWWERVVGDCLSAGSLEYFCFQVNQRYRDDMCGPLHKAGWKLADELHYDRNPVSHFNKPDGNTTKREYESMLVFSR